MKPKRKLTPLEVTFYIKFALLLGAIVVIAFLAWKSGVELVPGQF